jgi:hypothetical protein
MAFKLDLVRCVPLRGNIWEVIDSHWLRWLAGQPRHFKGDRKSVARPNKTEGLRNPQQSGAISESGGKRDVMVDDGDGTEGDKVPQLFA